jgi:membrane protease YdiL (CAAX protease family)
MSFIIPGYSGNYNLKKVEMINAVIFAPICEELIFRGIILNQYSKKYSFVLANIIQAGLFAILHLDINVFIFHFYFGIILGLVAKYLSLYSSMIIHSLNNLSVVTSIIFHLESIELHKVEGLLIGLMFMLITIFLLNKLKDNECVT